MTREWSIAAKCGVLCSRYPHCTAHAHGITATFTSNRTQTSKFHTCLTPPGLLYRWQCLNDFKTQSYYCNFLTKRTTEHLARTTSNFVEDCDAASTNLHIFTANGKICRVNMALGGLHANLEIFRFDLYLY